MEESAVTSAEAVPRARARTARKPKKDRTPWYMWVAVAAIVLFCLFPFYWLINMSLKAGSDLNGSAIFPHNEAQKAEARRAIERAKADWPAPIVTTIEPLGDWWSSGPPWW